VTRQALDQARAEAAATAARLTQAEARLAQLRISLGREPEIAAQRAVVVQNQAQLAQAEWRLAQRRVVAPVAALVNEVYAWPGETLAAGAPVVSLLPPGNILVRFFVPEAALPSVRSGTEISIACDLCPADLRGEVSFVSPQAEYTPPVIFSEATRGKLIYMIEAHPKNAPAGLLKPGQPVTVRLPP
jgi:HlyD family secretion protein